jgi:hypothetical protein
LPNNFDTIPEVEWDLTVCLALCPVLEYGVDIILVKVIVLLEGYVLGQILRLDIVNLCPLQFLPGDLSLSLAYGYI